MAYKKCAQRDTRTQNIHLYSQTETAEGTMHTRANRNVFRAGLAALVFSCAGLTGPVAAQSSDAIDKSAAELEEIFKKQKTRGLVLAPTALEDATEDTAAVDADGFAPTTYVELAPDEQVNIQISFDFDSAALREDQKPKLVTLCQVMSTIEIDVFRIVGHTDAKGSAEYNEGLSLLRAEEVKRHLVNDCGISTDRLQAVGVGEAFPLNKNNPQADENRRVEFQALS